MPDNDNNLPPIFTEDVIRAAADYLFAKHEDRLRYLAKVAESGMIASERTVRIPHLGKIS